MSFRYTLSNKTIPDVATYLSQLKAIAPSILSVFISGEEVAIDSTQELYANALVAIDNVVPASRPAIEIVKERVIEAIMKGNQIIVEFSAENIMMGITQKGKTREVREATSSLIEALKTGSLYDAIAIAKTLPDSNPGSEFITAPRILKYVNQIEEFLGVPKSTEL